MDKDMKKIDELIEQALSEEERTYFHQLDEQNLLQMVGGLFRGKLGWVSIMAMIMSGIFFALFIISVVRLVQADDVLLAVKWGVATIICFLATQILKIWQWMQLDKNALLRELKRLEYQISLLGARRKR
ncbi:MAG: DUF6768 family protein [Bacteroidota bacterium]